MSLSFLPLPIFIVLVVFSAIGMFVIAKKYNSKQKLLTIGYSFIGLGALGGAIIRINSERNFMSDATWLGVFILICTGTGVTVSLYAKYLTIKDDLGRKRSFLKILFGWLVFMILMGIFLGFVFLKMKNII